jgi:hypothetical protein
MICFSIVGCHERGVTPSCCTASSRAVASNCGNRHQAAATVHSDVMMLRRRHTWYSGADSSAVPRGVPSAMSVLPTT